MPTIKQYQRMRESEMEFPETRREDDPMYIDPNKPRPKESDAKEPDGAKLLVRPEIKTT